MGGSKTRKEDDFEDDYKPNSEEEFNLDDLYVLLLL